MAQNDLKQVGSLVSILAVRLLFCDHPYTAVFSVDLKIDPFFQYQRTQVLKPLPVVQCLTEGDQFLNF